MNWLTQLFGILGKPFQWWVIVAPWEQALRVRGGSRRFALGPGVHLRIPFWDRIYIQSVRLRVLTNRNQTVMTRDRHTYCVSVAVEFAIADIGKLYSHLASPDLVVEARAFAAVVNWITAHDASELQPATVAEAARSALLNMEDWGLTSPHVSITAWAELRTYRLVMNDYRDSSGLFNLDTERAPGAPV